jgi:RNA methyltransferase, TrmH family
MSREPHLITSLTNDRIKAIRALDMRKERKETGLFVAEGVSILVTARDHGFKPETLVFQTNMGQTAIHRELIAGALEGGGDVLEVSEPVLSKLASKENPQAMLGVFTQRWSDAPKAARMEPDACWLVLEDVRDPGNLGTIIRTADAVGASGVILTGNCCDAYARETVRATMGSIFAMPLVRMSREEFLAWRADWPGDVAGTHLNGKEDFRKAALRGPVLLLMGSEGPGLSESLTRSCTKLVKIPMAGNLDSLNLAVATALALYQIRGSHLKL